MLFSLLLLIILGLVANRAFQSLGLPGILGIILVGVLLGPYGLDWLHPVLLQASADLRSLALIIILLRAGLGIQRETLRAIGKRAILMGILPGLLEGVFVTILATYVLGLPLVEAGLLGFILAAVSPAVVVPQMLSLKESGWGQEKAIPTLILAGASLDDVVAITFFSAFVGMVGGVQTAIWLQVAQIPLAAIGGILMGGLIGWGLHWLFERWKIRSTEKTLILLASSIALLLIGEHLGIAGLLGVMVVGYILLERNPRRAKVFASKLNKVWVLAEIFLFALIGAEVNLEVAWGAGLIGLGILGFGLVFRSLGVFLATWGSDLNLKERIFCLLAYIPKATVQAAIGGVPLALGLASGEWILAIAVLSITVTAPLGALAIRYSAPRLLKKPLTQTG